MKNILEDIKNNIFHRVYLLYGSETYLRSQYRDRLVRALIPDGDTMNFSRFEGKNTDPGEVISLADTMPFFAEHRVILLEETGFFKNKTDRMTDYLENLPDYLVLIFCETEIDKRGRAFKTLQKAGLAADFSEQKEEILVRWVLGILKKEGKKITRQDMEHFLSMTGTDMHTIRRELDKLLAYTLGREAVTRADMDAVCVEQLSDRVFDMVRAVTEHRNREAMEMYADLLAQKEPPLKILYLIGRQYNQLLQMRMFLAGRAGQKEIAEKLGIPAWSVGKQLPVARRYTEEQLRGMVEKITQTETDVKTGRLQEALCVELILCAEP